MVLATASEIKFNDSTVTLSINGINSELLSKARQNSYTCGLV